MTEALFEKKAVLLTGNTGVGKTYLAKKISEKLVERKYSCFPSSKDQIVNVEIISCHNSVTYEEIIGGITADTDSGKMFFEYKDKIFLETIIRAASDYNEGKGTKYVLIMDDLQRNDVSTLIGDAVNAIGLEGEEGKLCLNSGMVVEIPPNFYIIGTYNAAETGAILLPSDLISKFYVREILSEIEYVTEDLETENAIYYDQVRSLVLNYLDIQYRRSTYDQSRYFLGHGYFSGNNVSLKIRYQLIPILKQYISEGILDSAAEESVHLLEAACIKKKEVVGKNVQKSIFSEYRCGVTAARFINEDSTRKCSSIPIENLVGRIIDQQLLTDEKIKYTILFNKKVCYREMEVGGVTYQAMLIADSVQHNKIRRSGKSDGRCLYNGGKIFIDDLEYHFTGGFHPRDYVKAACWENTDGYRLGESFGGNLVLFRIVWQYYQALIEEYTLYLKSNSADRNKQKLLDYIKDEWNLFLNDFKKIEPKSVKKIGREDKEWKQEEAVYNQEANTIVRKRIARLTILWSNPGDMITVEDGSEVILEGVDNKMRDSIYKEYEEAMELLGIKQMILQGPPGTSKTYSAKAFLKYMAHNCSDEELAALQIVDYFAEDKYCAKLRKEKGDPEIAWDIVQLLCKGDYHLDDSNNSSFLVDFDRDISWKRLLRIQSNEKHGTYKTRRKMLMDLINDPLFDINDIGGGLINICNRDIGKITNWRKYFISVPGVMDALHDYSAYKPKERYIRIEGDNIFLMGSTRLYGYNKEYYSFALCCMLECLGKYSVRYEDAKGWEDIHHQIEVTEKSTGEVYEIKYRRSDKKFSIYKKDGSATVYANLEDTFNALK